MKIISFKISGDISFEEFIVRLQNLTIFNNLDEFIKRFFYNIFVKKARNKEKEATKKAKKIQKKYFKMLRTFK